MTNDKIQQLTQGLQTAFIDQAITSNLAYKPQFVSNNYKEGRKVISSIEDELLSCNEFYISVAFITQGGITPLLQTLRELEQRGIPGKILTTDYLTFSEPKALRMLANFKNIELKMFMSEGSKDGFHTKGYIFKKENIYQIIVGSSNMTLTALTTNREWNTKIVATEDGEYTHTILDEFIMLRPTESPIVFIQQLGRGLRKAEGKEYVVVLDFIGNYRNNFMIPIALSGDRSYNKDNIRRYITEGGRVIPGASTIHFDEISRKRIFQAIDNANFSDIKLIRENYTNLKNKLGHIPALADFDKYGEMDVLRIFDNNSLGSYYKFLVKYEKEYKIRLSANEEKVIEFVSKKLASGKRIHELELLKRSLKYHHGLLGLLQESLSENYQQSMDENCAENIINMMTNHFPTNAAQKTYANCVFLEKEEDDYAVSKTFEAMLQNPDFYHILEELVDFGISRYHANYCNRYQNTDLVLYQKYTYEDVCRLLNWERNEVPLNIGGYKFDKKTKTFPIFINYDKQDDISDTTKYEDHFVGDNRLIAISKSGRTIASEDVQNFLHAKERGIDVQLFVRKNKDDKISKEFYYLGRLNATGQVKEFIMPNTDKTAVEIEWVLDTPVREDIYEYIVNG